MPPSITQRRLALAIAAFLLVGSAMTFPFARIQLAPLPEFVPVAATALMFAHLITATLLYTLFSVLGWRSLLPLASGYLLTGILLSVWGLTFPHAFTPSGLLGAQLQTTIYAFVFSRLVLPFAVIAYAVLKGADRLPVQVTNSRAIMTSVAATLLIATGLVLTVTKGASWLPPIMVSDFHGNHVTGPFFGIVAIALLLFAMAFLWRRNMSVLDLWLLLTLWNWLVEIIVLRTTTDRFTFNWYAGLVLELGSTTFILAGLLSQTLALYARLALATEVQRRERENRHLALHAALSMVAHETYQPITAIAANSSAGLRYLNKDRPDLDEVRQIFGDIIADTRRTSDSIDAIRALFRVDASEKTPLQVESLVQEVLAMVQSELRAHNVAAGVSFELNLPCIHGNREQLQQVLLNLIANAIEAMDSVTSRPRTLEVWAARDGDEVLVTLKDSGPGIDPSESGRIFDPFVTTKAKGTGLGLPICKSIIEAHAGRMRARPAVPNGAVFGFTLPVAQSE
jgi:signal transduction histidine kinase